jgi:hypothetical protein
MSDFISDHFSLLYRQEYFNNFGLNQVLYGEALQKCRPDFLDGFCLGVYTTVVIFLVYLYCGHVNIRCF